MSLNPYRPSNGAVVTFNAGLWSATGRPTCTVAVSFDARLLTSLVLDASRRPSHQITIGLGSPRATVTLTF